MILIPSLARYLEHGGDLSPAQTYGLLVQGSTGTWAPHPLGPNQRNIVT